MTNEKPFGPTGSPEDGRPLFGVLLECRGEIVRRVGETLERGMCEIRDELQAQQHGAVDAAESARLADIAQGIEAVRDGFARKFERSFEPHFTARARPAARRSTVYEETGILFPELSLVDDDAMNETLFVRMLAARLEAAGGRELQTLQVRVAFLLGTDDEIQDAANPLGAAPICEALKDLCRAHDASGGHAGMILDRLVTRLADDIAAIYADVNALLASRKVMPGARARIARRSPDGAHHARRAGGALTEAEKRANDIVRQLLSAKGRGSDGALSPAGAEGNGIAALLTRLQRGEAVPLGGDAFSLPQNSPEATNLITVLRDAGFGKQLGAVDALVIDVVATLFDYIFDDARVPEPIKGLIGRLQIPVLKLAMMDHAFFSNRTHPARRLINALAQAAATWDGEVTRETSLYRAAEVVVLRIQNEFAEDAEIFARCQQDFDAYLAEQDRHADERAATLTDRLKQRERHELARNVAQNAIRAPLAHDGIPEVVRTFAGTVWLKVMTRAVLEGGEGGEAWREANIALEDLVWSVLPKHDAESRQKMVQRLPALLRGIKAGMKLVAVDEAAQKQFFAELVQLHAAALKAGMTSGAAAPSAAPTNDRGVSRAADDEPTPESLELDLLGRGSWVELRDESGGVRRVRLTWISPARTMYLFANRQGQRALALTRSELMRRFATGEAATASDEPLLDRVVDDVLDEFQR